MDNYLENNALIMYKGPFHIKVLSDIVSTIKSVEPGNVKLQIKLKKIIIEMAQNIAYYSMDRKTNDDVGIGSLIIEDMVTSYKITTTNTIKRENGSSLIQYCNLIDHMTNSELRKFKADTRRIKGISEKGAHIGLIQIGILSSRTLEPEVVEINDKISLFLLHVILNKNIC